MEYHVYVTPRNFGVLETKEDVWLFTFSGRKDRRKVLYEKFENKDDAVQFLIEHVGYKSVEFAGLLNPDCHYATTVRVGYFGARSDRACGVFYTLQKAEDSFDGHNNVSISEFFNFDEAVEFAFGRPLDWREEKNLVLDYPYRIEN